ncbi:MAG: hypothetical protein JST47_02750 [Bacteroidetes bacterium]|nr:hypothetical protein [Bacteroidota bacterium]MBS1975549.1 hypothetical protein [Bacteroidota bacterium]
MCFTYHDKITVQGFHRYLNKAPARKQKDWKADKKAVYLQLIGAYICIPILKILANDYRRNVRRLEEWAKALFTVFYHF